MVKTNKKPVWYATFPSRWGVPKRIQWCSFRFYFGKVGHEFGNKDHWCLNIGLGIIDFGRAY